MSKKANDITVPTTINGVTIPSPSEDDLQWAEDIKNKKSKVINAALDHILIGDKNLWRIAFIVNIPKIDNMFISRGLSPSDTRTVSNKAIEIGSIDIFKILRSEHAEKPYYGSICKAIRSNHYDMALHLKQNFDELLININTTNSYYYVENQHYYCHGLQAAVHSGNIDMVKLLIESGENLIRSGDDALTLAKNKNDSEIYKYLKYEMDKAENAFAPEDPAPLLLTIEEDPWEKIDASSIVKHLFLENGQAKISNLYDFENGQIMTVYQKDGMPPSTPTFQNFDDIQKDSGITSAFNKLVSLDGNPKPYIRGQVDKKNSAKVFKIKN